MSGMYCKLLECHSMKNQSRIAPAPAIRPAMAVPMVPNKLRLTVMSMTPLEDEAPVGPGAPTPDARFKQ